MTGTASLFSWKDYPDNVIVPMPVKQAGQKVYDSKKRRADYQAKKQEEAQKRNACQQ